MQKLFCLAGLIAAAAVAPVHAATCEQAFEAVGDPRNGMVFTSLVKVPGLSISSALGQLQQAALDDGLEVGGELITPDEGEVSFLQTNLRVPLVIRGTATKNGNVIVGMKLARGQTVKNEDAQTHICGMLNKLKPGKEGEAIAAQARATTGTDRMIDAKADVLSAQVKKEVEKTMRSITGTPLKDLLVGGNTPMSQRGDIEATFAPIAARYVGRKYRIDGQLYTVSPTRGPSGRVDYLVTPTRGLLRVRQDSTHNSLNFGIACHMAADQKVLLATLRESDWAKLEGTVERIDTGGMVLRDCRQAKG